MMALKEIDKDLLKTETTVIAKSLEKFICMKVAGITLKDSCKLLNCRLDKLFENLKDKGQRERGNFPYNLCILCKEMVG